MRLRGFTRITTPMKPSESLFLNTFSQQLGHASEVHGSIKMAVQEIAKSHLLDLSPPAGLHYSVETQDQLTAEAARRLALAVSQSLNSEKSVNELWQDIATDFHRNNRWNFQAGLKTRPQRPPTQEQKVFRELLPYVWSLVQSVVIMKAAVYYFGMQSSNEPSTQNNVLFAITLTISFGSLFIFAWRKSRNENKLQ